MDRMLGNQYFLARKFKEAIPHFEKVLVKSPGDSAVFKNLIFCLVVTEELDKAVAQMIMALHHSPEFLVELSAATDTNPYQEVFLERFTKPPATLSGGNYALAMGILSLYCHAELAVSYFHEAKKHSRNKKAIEEILRILSNENDILEVKSC